MKARIGNLMDKLTDKLMGEIAPTITVCADQAQGIELCKQLHIKLEPLGYYPALTGGLLYREGSRKDIDIVIYRNRQRHKAFDMLDIKLYLEELGITNIRLFGFVTKCRWQGLDVDLINPEDTTDGEYRDIQTSTASIDFTLD